jgi:hypothetical protein
MSSREGLTLRQAALIAGFAYLLNPVTYAEFSLYPRLVAPGHIEQTVANIVAHQGQFVALLLSYIVNFIGDVVIAWALYFLFVPVNRAVSLLAALFQLIYATIALVGTFNLAVVYRMLTNPEYARVFGANQLHAEVDLLLHWFRIDWSLGLALFGVHLVLVGGLIYWSTYAPKWLGVILAINGFGWTISELQPYMWPNANLGFLFVTYFGEVIFLLWLLIMGWRIKEPAALVE